MLLLLKIVIWYLIISSLLLLATVGIVPEEWGNTCKTRRDWVIMVFIFGAGCVYVLLKAIWKAVTNHGCK